MRRKPVIPNIKVKDMDFIDGDITREMRIDNGAELSSGGGNAYRIAFMKGQGASSKDESWNKEKHQHACCGSKVSWRHLIRCPMLREDFI